MSGSFCVYIEQSLEIITRTQNINIALDKLFDLLYYITTPQGGVKKDLYSQLKKEGNRMQADKAKVTRLLKTARGQIDGILKMVESDRYCIDISHQLMATEAILNKVNKEILTEHLKSCVAHAETEKEKEEKIDELVSMLGRIMK